VSINKMPAEQPRMATTNGSQPSANGIVKPIDAEVPLAVKTGTDMAQIMRIAAAMATSPVAARSPAARTRAEGGPAVWAGALAVCWYVVGPSSAKPCIKDGGEPAFLRRSCRLGNRGHSWGRRLSSWRPAGPAPAASPPPAPGRIRLLLPPFAAACLRGRAAGPCHRRSRRLCRDPA